MFFFQLIKAPQTILAARIFILKFCSLYVVGFQTSRLSRLLDFQIPRFPDTGAGAAGTAAGQTFRSQTDTSPNAPGEHIRCKELGALAATKAGEAVVNVIQKLLGHCKDTSDGILHW